MAYSDASDSGYGGYVVELGRVIVQGQWSALQAQQSSTWRELKAVDEVLRSLADKLAGHTVKWFTDSQNVVRIIQVGSKKPHLQDGTISIFQNCLSKNIRLELEWIPRTLNEKADYISRLMDWDDWQLSPSIFQQLDVFWVPIL